MKKPLVLYPLLTLHLLLGVGALFGGWGLMADAEGLGLNPDWLAGSPFKSYRLPGLILFIFNGLFPLFAATGLLFRPAWPWANVFNIYRDRYWAWTYSLFSGIIILIWLTVQIMLMPYYWLQPFFMAVGLLVLILTLWPGMLRYYRTAEK